MSHSENATATAVRIRDFMTSSYSAIASAIDTPDLIARKSEARVARRRCHCVWANGVLVVARVSRVAQQRATKERTGGDDRYARAHAVDDDEALSVLPCE